MLLGGKLKGFDINNWILKAPNPGPGIHCPQAQGIGRLALLHWQGSAA